MTLEHVATIPMLRCFDEAKARDFYCGFLGFAVDFEHRFEPGLPLFLRLSRGGMVLYLSEHHGDAAPGAHVVFKVRGLEAFHAGLVARNYPHARPGLEPHVGGGRHVTVDDPFGNCIEFVEDPQ